MRASVAGLRLAAPDMAAMGAQPKVERRAALLTSITARGRDRFRSVGAGAPRRYRGLGNVGEVHTGQASRV